jgi:uncharacterized membrane protein YgcG
VAVAASTSLALALTAPVAAEAARRPSHHPATRTFVAHGVVVRHTGATMTVLATDVRSGRSVVRNRTLTVSLPSRASTAGRLVARKMRGLANGDRVTVTGVVTGQGRSTRFQVGDMGHLASAFHSYIGVISAVSGSLLTVHKGTVPSDDANENDNGSFTVDDSTANVLVDLAAGTPAVGQSVLVLGSSVNDVVVATSVFAFSTPPDVLRGRVSAVNGTTVTVGGEEDAQTQVDLSSTTLIVDGVSNSTPAQVTVGAKLVALGWTNDAGVFVPVLAVAFSHTCDSHHHGDGGHSEDGPGSPGDGGSGSGGSGSGGSPGA